MERNINRLRSSAGIQQIGILQFFDEGWGKAFISRMLAIEEDLMFCWGKDEICEKDLDTISNDHNDHTYDC